MPNPTPIRQRILITGASSGLGEAMARRFAAAGRDLALSARRRDLVDALAAELRGPSRIHVGTLDVTDADAVRAHFTEAAAELGGLDRVIVNAGIGKGRPIGTGGAHANAATATTNFLGALHQTEAAMEIFRAQGHGHLVLMSSVAGARGLPKKGAIYSASKAAVSSLGESLQIELGHSPIKVTVLTPGFIDTPMAATATQGFMTSIERGGRALFEAIEAEPSVRTIPRVPWLPVRLVLTIAPQWLLRRVMS